MRDRDAMTGLRARSSGLVLVLACTALPLITVHGSDVSRQQAESLLQKVTDIQAHAESRSTPAPRRTTLSESEVNSWFAYHAPDLLPDGIAQPRVTILGSRRVRGTAVVDLDAVSRQRASGGLFDVWNFVGGRLPVTVTGLLHADGGRGRFELQQADISGVPVPMRMVDELVQYYSRTPDRPTGLRLTETFELPAGIKQVDLRPGAAVVVQ
jgi:hypothetical protein